jgi:hypothetical protein
MWWETTVDRKLIVVIPIIQGASFHGLNRTIVKNTSILTDHLLQDGINFRAEDDMAPR